jgi:DNA-binding CsgD family transcriptional regulator
LEDSLRKSQLKELQVEQKFITEKNHFLENEFRQKKKELANTLLHLNKNLDLLIEVKDQLNRSSNSSSFLPLIDRINKSLNEGDSWHLLEEAFNNIDNEFLTKLKNEFSDLSSSELKMCVYLRLNLSTKEIATLLNITPKSVEIKRYRLRKKLRLGQEEQLQDYILRY